MQKQVHLPWIDFAKSLAILGVIIIHVSGSALYQFGKISKSEWWVGNLFDGTARFSIPLFVMITGTLLLPLKKNPIHFYKSRGIRLIPPFLFWSFVYLLFYVLVNFKNDFQNITSDTLFSFILKTIRNGITPHFWFVFMIIGINLLIPLLHKATPFMSLKFSFFTLLLWLILICLMQLLLVTQPDNKLIDFIGFVGIAILGSHISQLEMKPSGLLKLVSLMLIVFGVIVTLFFTYSLSKKQGGFNELFYNYLSFNVITVSVGVYLLIQNSKITNEKMIRLVRKISKHSYGIFFVHILVLWYLGKAGMHWNTVTPVIGIPITSLLCLYISYFLIFLLNKLPFGKYVSG